VYVLIVDDDHAMRRLLEVKLTAEGFEVATAEDGPAALGTAQDRLPDLILLDGMLPGMPGSQVARALRANPATAGVPILMLSAVQGEDHIERAYASGIDDYVTKPFNLNDVVGRVRALLDRPARNPVPPE
jgi:two-component system, OmpR family, phosphate regulon response regulator PhoB